MALSALFFIVPLAIQDYGFEKAEFWKIYIPMLLFGATVMVFAAAIAEIKKAFKQVMLVGASLMILGSIAICSWHSITNACCHFSRSFFYCLQVSMCLNRFFHL